MSSSLANLLTLLMLLVLLPGCRRSDPQLAASPGAAEKWTHLPDQPELEVRHDSDHVAAARVSGGLAVPLVKGTALVEDKMVLEVAPGEVVVVRQPSAIAKDVSSLAHVYIRDGEDTLVTTEGFKGEPYVDPQDRKLCWSARTCTNPACPGQRLATPERPFLYSVRVPQYRVSDQGEITTDGSEFSWPSMACPQCGRPDATMNWCPADVRSRREELAAELDRSRRLRDQAERAAR